MEEKIISLTKTVAVLLAVIIAAGTATFVLLALSIFQEIGLLTAFPIQLLAAIGGLIVSLWRVS